MSHRAGRLRRPEALQLSIWTASVALPLTSTGRELVETERRHIHRPVEAAQTVIARRISGGCVSAALEQPNPSTSSRMQFGNIGGKAIGKRPAWPRPLPNG